MLSIYLKHLQKECHLILNKHIRTQIKIIKEKRFGSLQNFTQYVSKNKELYLSYNNKNAKQYGDFDSMEEYMIYMAKI